MPLQDTEVFVTVAECDYSDVIIIIKILCWNGRLSSQVRRCTMYI